MRPLCVFHYADLDGKASAAIVKYALRDVELYGYNYGQPIPWEKLRNRDVIMVDISFQPFSEMEKLKGVTNSLVWIDHHEAAIVEANKAGWLRGVDGVSGIWETGVGACELTWRYYFPDNVLPISIKLLSLYDVWNHEDPRVLQLQFGMRLEDTRPESVFWVNEIFRYNEHGAGFCEPVRVMRNGEVILQYQKQQNEAMAKARSFATELDGLRLIACNTGLNNSNLFDSVWDPNKYDAMCLFQWAPKEGGQWTVSLYSQKKEINLGELCKKRGGGGHVGAAGFQCKELPFRLGSGR